MRQMHGMIKIIFILVSVIIFSSSCSRTDFSNPEMVFKAYREMAYNNHNFDVVYDKYLSTKSKEFCDKRRVFKNS